METSSGSIEAMQGNEEQFLPQGGETVTCEMCEHFLRSPGKEPVGLSEMAFWCPAKAERRFCGRSITCPDYKACGECIGAGERSGGSA